MSIIETALNDVNVTVAAQDYQQSGIHAQAEIQAEQLKSVCRALYSFCFFLETVTAVDNLSTEIMQGVWFFNHYRQSARLKIVIETGRNNPVFPSIATIYPGAAWHERETGEFFGIVYEGSKDSRCLLLPEDVSFHPLRKDFKRSEQQIAGIH